MKLEGKSIRSQELISEIGDKIKSGELKPGQRLLSLRDISKQYGISVTHARTCFAFLEKEGLLIQRHGSGTYVNPDIVTSKFQNCFGVITTYQRGQIEGYFEDMIQVSSAKNVITLPLHLNADDKWQQCFAKLSEFNLKAVFIDVEAGGKPLKEIYRAAGDIPLCFVNRWEWQQPLPQLGVLVDYVAAYMQALKLLFEKGHKRILFAHYHITAPEKYQATLKAAANRTGYEFPSYELEYLGFSENGELMDKEFNRIFGDPKNAPTALLAVSDYIASKIIERAEKINPMAAGIETIGFFNTANSKVPGHEFSSFEIDYVNMWNKAFEMFNDKENSTTIEWIIPKLIWR